MPAQTSNMPYGAPQQPYGSSRTQSNSFYEKANPSSYRGDGYWAQPLRNTRDPLSTPPGQDRPSSSRSSASRDSAAIYGGQRRPLSDYKTVQPVPQPVTSAVKRSNLLRSHGGLGSQKTSNRLTKLPPAFQQQSDRVPSGLTPSTPRQKLAEPAPKIDSSDLFDFGPPVSFDDLQQAITDTASRINNQSSAANTRSVRPRKEPASSSVGGQNPGSRRAMATHSEAPGYHAVPSQLNHSTKPMNIRQSSSMASGLTIDTTHSQPSNYTRRRSNFAPPASKPTSSTREIRMSMGPVPRDITRSMSQHKRPGLAAKIASSVANSPNGALSPSSEMQSFEDLPRVIPASSLRPGTGQPPSASRVSFPSSEYDRASSFRSFQASGEQTPVSARSKHISPTSPYISNFNNQGKSPTDPATAPAPPASPRASGLGARTISPTDLAILRRLSTIQQPPPIPNTPPTPLPEFRSRPSSTSYSSSYFVPKVPTPVSSRATPEAHRRPYVSNVSSSSTTNLPLHNRSSHSSLYSRLSQSIPTSRLPTPKLRSSNTPGPEKDVPPVPAIPRAYDSPKEMGSFTSLDDCQFGAKSDYTDFATGSAINLTDKHFQNQQPSMQPGSHVRRERGSIISSEAIKSAMLPSDLAPKEALRPLRLPPLRLAPLDDFPSRMTRQINQGLDQKMVGGTISPTWQTKQRTPSTPMTASKAFGSSADMLPPIGLPRSRSIYDVSEPYSATEPWEQPSPNGFEAPPIRNAAHRNTMTPYGSSSLPKPSGDFSQLQSKRSMDVLKDADPDQRRITLTGPRSYTSTKGLRAGQRVTSAITLEPESPSVQQTPRRQGSFSWRKSGRKSPPPISQIDSTPLPAPPDYSKMPPPRLPASATWSGSIAQAAAGIDPSRLQGMKTAKIPGSPSVNGHSRIPSGSFTNLMAPSATKNLETTQRQVPVQDLRIARKPTAYAQHAAGTVSKSSLATITKPRSVEAFFDGDDQAAENEMTRLGSSLKDHAEAAAELDALRMRAVPVRAITASQARRSRSLNIFEQGEITDYRDVYFCGSPSAKKRIGDMTASANGSGFDDEKGDYVIVNGDHLAYRYEVIGLLGKGSFGQVVKCVDHRQGRLVAVKIIRNKKRFHQQALVEVNILQKLREWDPRGVHGMVNYTQSFYFRGHLCISTELLDINLYELIKAHEFRGFSIRLIRRFTKQMLNSLVLLKSKRVIHCDLKPENILLTHPLKAEIKTIDFGSSCFENERVYTYIQSRFYRSPEVILGMVYGLPIDMWSLGCILAELHTGHPVFPGENEQEQLACIMEVLGPPERHLIELSSRKKLFFDSMGKPRMTVSSKGKRRRPSSKTLGQVLKCHDEVFLDFLGRCLRWDPQRRLKPDEAMKHDFITGLNKKTATSSHSSAGRPSVISSGALDSPLKRSATFTAPSTAALRPLPDIPTLNTRVTTNGTKGSSSPSKIVGVSGNSSRRMSTIGGLASSTSATMLALQQQQQQQTQTLAGAKRASNGAVLASNYSRNVPSHRLASARVEHSTSMAAAAGIAAMNLGTNRIS